MREPRGENPALAKLNAELAALEREGGVGRPAGSSLADSEEQIGPKKSDYPKRGVTHIPTILEFVERWCGVALSLAQRVLLKAIYGLALEGSAEREVYERCTGRSAEKYRAEGFSEVTVVAGARSGKDSRIAAPIALYEAIFGGHEVARGEVGVVPLYAQNLEATEVAFRYIAAYAQRRRVAEFVDDERTKSLVITSASGQAMRVVCFPCAAKAIRGFSVPAAVMDEVAYFRADSGKIVDREVQRAIRRGMVGFKRRRLVKISTPSTQVGVLHEDFERYHGQESADVLVWHAPTVVMNPTITESDLAEDRRKDPLAARREYDAEFVGDEASAYLAQAWVDAARVAGRFKLPPSLLATAYRAAVDPTGGGGDEFTLAIMHTPDGFRLVLDVMEGRKGSHTNTVELSAVVAEYATLLKAYGIGTVHGDAFAGDWVAQEFAKHGIAYTKAQPKKYAYLDAKPAFQEGRIELLDDGVLLGQLAALQQTWAPGSRVPTVDHPRGGHDDRANALAIVAAEFMRSMNPAVGGTLESLQAVERERTGEPEVEVLERMWRRPSQSPFWARERVGFYRR